MTRLFQVHGGLWPQWIVHYLTVQSLSIALPILWPPGATNYCDLRSQKFIFLIWILNWNTGSLGTSLSGNIKLLPSFYWLLTITNYIRDQPNYGLLVHITYIIRIAFISLLGLYLVCNAPKIDQSSPCLGYLMIFY